MEFIMQLCGAILAVAGSLLALTIAAIAFYTMVVGIQSCIEDAKKKRGDKK